MDIGDIKYLEVKEPAKVLKLSEAIRIGCEYVQETFLYSGCAIGTGYKALTGRDLEEDGRQRGYPVHCELVAEAFRMPIAIVQRASGQHASGLSRMACADYLESEGY